MKYIEFISSHNKKLISILKSPNTSFQSPPTIGKIPGLHNYKQGATIYAGKLFPVGKP